MALRFKRFHEWFGLLACLGLAACADQADTQGCQLVHVTDLKLSRRQHAFYTDIKINGQTATLQLDTGSEENLITDASAKRLGMHVNISGWNSVVGIGGSRETGEARSHEVMLGQARGEDLTFATIPAEAYRGADGLLGMNFLYGFDLDLDFWGQRVGLYKALGGCGRPSAAMAEPLFSVPLLRKDRMDGPGDLSPAIHVSINGVRLRAVIDTGAFHTTIFRDTARRVGLRDAAVLASTMARGVGPREVGADVRMSTPVQIGDLTVNNMPVVVADQKHPGETEMLLGYDFVTRVHLWISRSSHTLIMQYPPRASGGGA